MGFKALVAGFAKGAWRLMGTLPNQIFRDNHQGLVIETPQKSLQGMGQRGLKIKGMGRRKEWGRAARYFRTTPQFRLTSSPAKG